MAVRVTRTLMDYADLLNRPAPVSTQFVPMDRAARAAQFAAYKALEGFEDMVIESARETEERRVVPEEGGDPEINERLALLEARMAEHPEVTVLWFRPDERKQGGRTEELTGRVKRIDPLTGRLVLLAQNGISDGDSVPLRDITRLDGAVFDEYFW